jgi:NADH:ubiquinone oxidoreductase subunit 6 (subunit J)
MTLVSFMFYFFEAIAALSAIGVALVRNVFYGALLLIVCLLALAGIYVLAFAEFIAVTQILIYAGGILVIIIFGIMLTTKISDKPMTVEHAYTFPGALLAFSTFSFLIYILSKESFTPYPVQQQAADFTSINSIGIALMSEYMLPFEIGGLLLLVALIGASVVASTINANKN